ncbi:MAG: hypothetical protein KC616_02350 [Myxococcales bacterium]|nr:hypothetical protein [Myxococcales bacterium]
MAWSEVRVSIRYSINGDDGSLTTAMKRMLEGYRFRRIGTSEYERSDLPLKDLDIVMTEFWKAVAGPQSAFPSRAIKPTATIDHIWVHVCQIER